MHWPSFLAGLLVLPAFVLFAGVAHTVVQTFRRHRDRYLDPAGPLPRGAEPLEFTSRVMGGIRSELRRSRSRKGSARAS